MEQLRSHWTDFNDISYASIFQKSVHKIQVSLEYEINNGYISNDPRKCIQQLDMVAKINQSTKVYGNINTVCLLHVSATHMAILKEVRYKCILYFISFTL